MTTINRRTTWRNEWDALDNPHTMFPSMRTLLIIGSGVLLASGLIGVVWIIRAVTL